MTQLTALLDQFRASSKSEREKGTYFEELIVCYLRNEATYRDLYSDVWTYAQWADLQGLDKRDAGIDLVAKTHGTGEYHAIQCKLYASDYRLLKSDIDSFFTASGKRPFTHRVIVSTTNHWSTHAEEALRDQQPPVSKIDLNDLENSQIDWAQYQPKAAPVLKVKKQLRPHQQQALDGALTGLQTADRGKLIMACGTGKTFTSLKIAEALAGKGKRVLFLVPSLSLLSQTLTEWTQESATPLHSFAVCSDSDVGKKRQKDDDSVQTFTHELRYPATTEPDRLATEMAKRHDAAHMSVVFSTYHSIDVIVEDPPNEKERAAFNTFAGELRDDLNGSISDGEVIEMLAQHLITKPVFDALFEDYSFAQHNPMSLAMQGVLDVLQEHRLDKEADTLQRFYDSVKMRAQGIDNAAGKQKIVVELYDKFFRNAFPKMTERLGIVYTPVEVVDFIIHSVAHILETEFGQTLGSKSVHIIDPFTGTGTFITRLLQSGLIAPEHLPHKYKHEIHANELVLLAYYIAAINVEAVYHSIVGGKYQPFEGICLTDTFQMYEKEDLVDALLVDNSARRKRQKKLDIRVVIGNPPYSIGQGSQNDNNQNVAYPHLDSQIEATYAARSEAALSKGLYDSYIRAIRWASNRIGTSGVIGFVTNASFLDTATFDGLRRCLADEFSSIYIFHLRGNARTSGELRRQEGGNVFGLGSRAPIAISLLVKNPAAQHSGQIHFCDIGDYLNQVEKVAKIESLGSIAGITAEQGWQTITPDAHGDWLKQRDDSFLEHMVLGDKKGNGPALFETFSLGVVTNRDAWCYNASKAGVAANMTRMIGFYNAEADRLGHAHPGLDKKQREALLEGFINTDAQQIAWTRGLKQDLAKDKRFAFDAKCLVPGLYRPFNKQWLYFNRNLNEMVLQMPRLFPDAASKNIVIGVSASASRSAYSVFISDHVASLHAVDMVGSQYFPLYLYDEPEAGAAETSPKQSALFGTESQSSPAPTAKRRDAITAEGLAHFQSAYPGESIGREDLFYYVYGLLHSPDYRERFADNLGKELPRIPRVKTVADFWAFSQAGRKLAELHLNYESVEPYPLKIDSGGKKLTDADYRVEKMRYGKGKGKDKDLTTLYYNDKITLSGIPLEAYEYVVNGKPALDWVVERQGVKTDKDSGIVNDANDWAVETMGNPRYPLELLLRVITVSMETMKIVRALPALAI